MKLLALHSGARRGGNTENIALLAGERLRALAASAGVPLEFEAVALSEQNLALCRGCRVCFDRGEEKCPLKDGLSALCDKLRAADGVLFASPVYVEDVNAVMKNFIDRMAWNCHRPGFAGKTSYIAVTSGSGASNHAVRTLKYALGSWGFHLTGCRKFRMGALMDQETVRDKCGGSVEALAGELFRAVRDKRAERPSFFSLMMFKIQQTIYRTSPTFRDTYDRRWWEKNGWLDKKRRFYIPHRASPVKTAAARAFGAVMARIFG